MSGTADELAFDAICALCDEPVPDEVRPAARQVLSDMLISRFAPCDERCLALVDAVLDAAKADAAVSALPLEPTPASLDGAAWSSIGDVRIAIWRGDICRLAVGAIVNAANDQGLGCFQPHHRCIDNVLHRAAGPRLREECRTQMARRGSPLSAGTPPLLTSGYHLPAQHVLHVTGPCLQPRGRQPTADERATLARCYMGCLETAAAAGIRTLAFCCLSAGLFGYPSRDAAAVALSTVRAWLLDDPSRTSQFDALVFDVFTEEDDASYRALAPSILSPQPDRPVSSEGGASSGGQTAIDRAAAEIGRCDYLLIVAAAGLSISLDLPNNPYHSASDFARHYPVAARYGYANGFQAMGLAADERLPLGVRLAHTARHFLNMRFRFPPTPGYAALRALAEAFPAEHVFVWTSNVDGCFERAGFDPSRIYQTQGEMNRFQCARAGCGRVWECEEQLRQVDAAAVDGVLPDASIGLLACPRCGAHFRELRPNLRGGDWFDPSPYVPAAEQLLAWLDERVTSRAAVAVLEVGVGPNTPIVTRIPACAFASALAANRGRAAYVRVSPDPPEGPRENPSESVAFHRLRETWEVLEPLVAAAVRARRARSDEERGEEDAAPVGGDPHEAAAWAQRYRDILQSLRRPPR
jgi:O-acetyl-ADP-ribose deacetylase (regulator of RNase III)/NAD-dependent SIR2 family protein deacetylase